MVAAHLYHKRRRTLMVDGRIEGGGSWFLARGVSNQFYGDKLWSTWVFQIFTYGIGSNFLWSSHFKCAFHRESTRTSKYFTLVYFYLSQSKHQVFHKRCQRWWFAAAAASFLRLASGLKHRGDGLRCRSLHERLIDVLQDCSESLRHRAMQGCGLLKEYSELLKMSRIVSALLEVWK